MATAPTPVIPPDAEEAEGLLREFAEADVQYSMAKERREELRKRVVALVPKEPGAFEVKAGNWVLTIKYDEALKWNSEDLAAYYGSDLPPYVKRALSIDLRSLRRLPLSEQEELAKCYELGVASPKIDIATA